MPSVVNVSGLYRFFCIHKAYNTLDYGFLINKTMEKKEKNPLAMGLGRLGGLKTAQRGSEYYKNISKLGKEARRRNKINKIEAIVLVEEKVDENRLDGAGNAVVL